MTKIDFRLDGIPCLIAVNSQGGWKLLDRRGRHAPWLERKLDACSQDRKGEILDDIQCAIHDEFAFDASDDY